jgi:hypothetical protein
LSTAEIPARRRALYRGIGSVLDISGAGSLAYLRGDTGSSKRSWQAVDRYLQRVSRDQGEQPSDESLVLGRELAAERVQLRAELLDGLRMLRHLVSSDPEFEDWRRLYASDPDYWVDPYWPGVVFSPPFAHRPWPSLLFAPGLLMRTSYWPYYLPVPWVDLLVRRLPELERDFESGRELVPTFCITETLIGALKEHHAGRRQLSPKCSRVKGV